MQMRAKRVWCTLVLGSLLVMISSCGGTANGSKDGKATSGATTSGQTSRASWAAVVAAAKKEGSVNVYLGALWDVKGFEAKYPGIKVNVVNETSGTLDTRLDNERKAHAAGADVIVNSILQWWEGATKDGDILPLPKGPESAAWADSKDKLTNYYFNAFTYAAVIGWNTQLVPDGISNMNQVLSGKYKGQVATIDGTLSPGVMAQYTAWEDTYGKDFLDRLAAQNPNFYTTTPPMVQGLAAGENAVALIGAPPAYLALQAEGAPVAFTHLPGSPEYGNYAGIAGWARHPNAAAVFIDWMMSQEAQQIFATSFAGIVPGPHDVSPKIDPAYVVPYDSRDWPQSRQDQFKAQFNQVFSR
jgi:iron(III) transport system substrate-binding protein